MWAFIWKKHCFIRPCICACVCACGIKDKTAQTVNGHWRHATPRGYERVFVSLVSQESSSCLICTGVPLTRQAHLNREVINKNFVKNKRAGLSRRCPAKEILDLTFIPGQNLLVFSFSKNNLGAAERRRLIWAKSIKSGRGAMAGTKPVTRAWHGGPTLIVLILWSCF